MPVYTYNAADPEGRVSRESLPAPSELALERKLERDGKILINVLKVGRRDRSVLWGRKIKKSDLIEMAYHISVLCSSGLSLITGLEDFNAQSASPRLKKVLRDVLKDVNDGILLSDALARHPRTFPEVFVNLVRAGEASGSLDVVMDRFYREMEWQGQIKSHLVQALAYPAILLMALSGLVVLLLTFLLPKVMGLFPSKKMELPLPTKILVACSGFIQSHWILLLSFAILIPACIKITRLFNKGKYLTDFILIKLPLVGRIVLDVAVARFFSTFHTLFEAGVKIINSLKIAGASSGNSVISRRINRASEDIMKGALLSEAFEKIKEFNTMILNLVRMSEKTGQPDRALERITKYFDTVIPRKVKKMISFMEPAIIIAAGVLVGFILIGTLLPLFNLYSSM